MNNPPKTETATLAGGCFWCIQAAFDGIKGIISTTSGYSGGETKNPSYNDLLSGNTKHLESVQIIYDPQEISYEQILEIFWKNIDPTDENGQFSDKAPQYKTAIFYHNTHQKQIATQSKKQLEQSQIFDKPIVTEIKKYKNFYPAEEHHQHYHIKNPIKYKLYKQHSGRTRFQKNKWAQTPTRDNIHQTLNATEYEVTQNNATELPFENKYWNNAHEGIYVDIVSGEPLFSSKDKFDSKTGWPSFTKPLEPENIIEIPDNKLFTKRTEVRSKNANSHLGHLFKDGPKKSTGLRYCINSAALKFIPKEKLKDEGYPQYKKLFK